MRGAILGALVLLGGAPAWGQAAVDEGESRMEVRGGGLSLSIRGQLRFPDTAVEVWEQEVPAVEAPSFTVIDASGRGAGYSVTLQAGDLVGPRSRIPASALHFRAGGGVVTPVHGTVPPAESGQGSLAAPVKALRALPYSGMGTYVWDPSPASFLLRVPPTPLQGTYRCVVTVSITSGP